MDKIISEVLGNSGNVQFSPVLIVPVILVVIAAVAVFIFGFKKPNEPKFKKFANADVNQKKIKRKDPSANTNNTTTVSSTKLKQNGNATKFVKNVTTLKPIEESNKLPSVSTSKSKKSTSPNKSNPIQSTHIKIATNKKLVTTSVTTKKATAPAVTKKDKPQKKEKPVDFDDGEWQTVTSRTEKKKKSDDNLVSSSGNTISSDNKKSLNEKSTQKSTIIKNQKQLKDQVNKSKKEAADANQQKKTAAGEVTVVQISTVDSSPTVSEKPRKIEDVIAELATEKPKPIEEVIAELAAAKWELSNKNDEVVKKPLASIETIKNISNAKVNVVTSSDLDQAVESVNGAIDEIEDSWTEAKAPKKSKRRVRKD